jgi:hypothetical protein
VESLCLVHARAIVHTDVKPENILLVDQVVFLASRVLHAALHLGVACARCQHSSVSAVILGESGIGGTFAPWRWYSGALQSHVDNV